MSTQPPEGSPPYLPAPPSVPSYPAYPSPSPYGPPVQPGYAYPPPMGYAPYPPPRRRNKRLGWIIALIVVALLIGLGIAIAASVRAISGGLAPPRDATIAYFDALKAHDWQRAHSYLAAPVQNTVSPADLQQTWQRREQADGAIDRFEAININIQAFNGVARATVGGTLHYVGGANDPKIVTLVKEGDQWKLAASP